ncbi:DUF58 domain-containing protein [Rhodomicrobium sp.]|uniref:DUF58 domain-containing protein n=1 Tax=Rhodomicrobium sp. TaxID=2720632 RepID=UPI0039E265E7
MTTASELLSRPSALALEGASQDLVAKLPALLMEARRVAITVAQGTHGRRRAGPGETFWQYRTFEAGDPSALIDWRRSAGSSHLYVREREWEAAHTVWIWIDLSPSMMFRSHLASQSKAERAVVLALALATLLSEAGERVGIPGLMEPKTRRNAATAMVEAIVRGIGALDGLPEGGRRVSRHSEIVIFSDFLEPEASLAARFALLARQGSRGHLMRILDPAEESLPYQGRVDFVDAENGEHYVAERAESLRDDYGARLAAHKAALAQHARAVGWSPFLHHTDRAATEALLALHMHLSGLEKAYRATGFVKGQPQAGNDP